MSTARYAPRFDRVLPDFECRAWVADRHKHLDALWKRQTAAGGRPFEPGTAHPAERSSHVRNIARGAN
jgi:hypothetical protein